MKPDPQHVRRENSRHISRPAHDVPRYTAVRHGIITKVCGCGRYQVRLIWRNFDDPDCTGQGGGTGTGTGLEDCDPCNENCFDVCETHFDDDTTNARFVWVADTAFERQLPRGKLVIVARIPTGNAPGIDDVAGNPPFRWWIIGVGGAGSDATVVTDVNCDGAGGITLTKRKLILPPGTELCPATTEECGAGTGTGGGGQPGDGPCCEGFTIPNTLTISAATSDGDCTDFDGNGGTLTWDPAYEFHWGEITVCSTSVHVIFGCCGWPVDNPFTLWFTDGAPACMQTGDFEANPSCAVGVPSSVHSCDPFEVEFDYGNVCNGLDCGCSLIADQPTWTVSE